MPAARPHIGTLREGPLHASLKDWYSEPTDEVEAAVAGYVIDLVRDDLLIEIQTNGFAAMKRKAHDLIGSGHRIRIVYPVPVDRFIVKIDEDGTMVSRRRSPKHGVPVDVFAQLVAFPELVGSGLEIDIASIVEEEHRRHSPGKAWRRNGWVVAERRLIDILESTFIHDLDDLAAMLPVGLPDPFTTSDLASAIGRPRRLAQQMAYCLRRVGLLVSTGKTGNAIEYRVA